MTHPVFFTEVPAECCCYTSWGTIGETSQRNEGLSMLLEATATSLFNGSSQCYLSWPRWKHQRSINTTNRTKTLLSPRDFMNVGGSRESWESVTDAVPLQSTHLPPLCWRQLPAPGVDSHLFSLRAAKNQHTPVAPTNSYMSVVFWPAARG